MAVSERVVNEIEDAGVRLNGDVEIMPNWVLGPRPGTAAIFSARRYAADA